MSDYNYGNVKEVDLEYLRSLLNKENTEETQKPDMIVSPKHYQLFPEFDLEIKDILNLLLLHCRNVGRFHFHFFL